MKKIILFLFIIASTNNIVGQELPQIIPPSPEAANLARYADIPVSLYTGKPQINFPLYTLKCGNLELPISLSYYASGIRVEDYPTWAGIGWALNAGGVIARTIKGPSQGVGGNNLGQYLPISSYPSLDDFYNLVNLGDGYHNTESDIFYYNFSQYSGSFQIKNNQPVFRKYSNLKIEFPILLTNITITDENGNKYYFEPDIFGGIAWNDYYLKKIESVNKSDIIYFEYVQGDTYLKPPHKSDFYSLTSVIHKIGTTDQITSTENSGKLLRKIYTSNNDSIVFVKKDILMAGHSSPYDKHRQALDSIIVYNSNSRLLAFHLKTNNIQTIKPYTKYLISYPALNTTTDMNYRLYLDGFDKIDKAGNIIESYGFDYYGRTNDGRDSLANRYSFGQDFGGFYNGQDNNNSLVPSFNQTIYPSEYESFPNIYYVDYDNYIANVNISGANRSPNIEYMKMGTLKSIKYPTGGYAKFYFSQYDNPMGQEPMWGFKIDNIQYLDSDGSLQKSKKYVYGSPVLGYPIPSFWHYTFFNSSTNQRSFYPISTCTNPTCPVDWGWALVLSPNNAFDLGMNEGPMIGYGFVQEFEEGNGHTNYEFSIEGACYDDYPNIEFDVRGLFYNYSNPMAKSQFNVYNTWPLGPTPNNNWKMGTLLSETTYGEDNLAKKDSQYHYSHLVLDTVPGIKILPVKQDLFYLYHQFNYLSTWERLDSITKTIDGITKVTSYNYDERKQIAQISTIKSNGDLLTTNFTYPYDYASAIYGNMVSRNMLAPVIEKTETTNTTQTELIKTNYSFWKTEESSNNLVSGRLEVEKDRYSSQTSTFSIAETAQLSIDLDLWKDGDGYFVLEGYGPPDIYHESGIVETILTPGNYTLKFSFPESSFPATDFYGTADFSVHVNDNKYNMTTSNAVTNHIYPLSVEVKKGGSPIETRLNFNSYDSKGNIISVSKTNGIEEIYIWGYNLRYPIAKIINSNYSIVESLLGGAVVIKDFCSLPNPSDTEVRNFLSPLLSSSSIVQNMIVTTYTYDPLVGITSITDPKGYTMYYEYDDFNRLKFVKDAEGKLISENKYHYKDQ